MGTKKGDIQSYLFDTRIGRSNRLFEIDGVKRCSFINCGKTSDIKYTPKNSDRSVLHKLKKVNDPPPHFSPFFPSSSTSSYLSSSPPSSSPSLSSPPAPSPPAPSLPASSTLFPLPDEGKKISYIPSTYLRKHLKTRNHIIIPVIVSLFCGVCVFAFTFGILVQGNLNCFRNVINLVNRVFISKKERDLNKLRPYFVFLNTYKKVFSFKFFHYIY